MRWANLTVLITGASSGIGEAVALAYARGGARVALMARRMDRLERVAEQCRRAGSPEAIAIPGDVTSRTDVAAVMSTLSARWHSLDRAVLNAGVAHTDSTSRAFVECCTSREQTAEGFSASTVEEVMRTNYLGVVYLLEPILARMREQRSGTIAVTSSMSTDGLLHRSGPYSASKNALKALVDGLRSDAAQLGVTMVLLEPGFIRSDMTAHGRWAMPFVMDADAAAAKFLHGIERGQSRVRVPWQMSWMNRLAQAVPCAIRERIMAKVLPKAG
jgi:short-subunit dehydrogenase